MANNRIYIRCKHCGDYLFLGKTFGAGYYLEEYNDENFIKKINEFYDKHYLCTNDVVNCEFLEPKFVPQSVHYENNFEITYEHIKD